MDSITPKLITGKKDENNAIIIITGVFNLQIFEYSLFIIAGNIRNQQIITVAE